MSYNRKSMYPFSNLTNIFLFLSCKNGKNAYVAHMKSTTRQPIHLWLLEKMKNDEVILRKHDLNLVSNELGTAYQIFVIRFHH